ncbi:MAG TPA: hypothetical protein VHO72_09830 [Bacteroidales bacterium]|nr:hypothetical protein [Bacteroidales bacterium]
MELENACQTSSDQLKGVNFDAFIAVSGYESRSSFLATQINTSAIPKKIVLAFAEKKELLYRELNDKKYKELGFTFVEAPSHNPQQLPEIMDDIIEDISKDDVNILIDYSSMPKIWYSEILNYFNSQEDLSNVNLWFSYSPSSFIKSISSISNKYHDPIKPTALSNKPIALILGLGYEKGRTEDISKQLNAQVTYAFYANPSVDNRYVNEVLSNNESVLKKISNEKIIPYTIFDLNSVSETLTQLCINLRMDHQVLLVPVGPKPFTLMCFILASRYPDIKICRVSTIINSAATDHAAHGELLVYKVEFTTEETDY